MNNKFFKKSPSVTQQVHATLKDMRQISPCQKEKENKISSRLSQNSSTQDEERDKDEKSRNLKTTKATKVALSDQHRL